MCVEGEMHSPAVRSLLDAGLRTVVGVAATAIGFGAAGVLAHTGEGATSESTSTDNNASSGYDIYISNPVTNDLKKLVKEFENGKEVWPWVWTWRNANGPHHVFVGVNSDTIYEIERLARDDVRNNITLIESEAELLQLRPMKFYEKCQCGMIDEQVRLMDVRAKIMMLEDERIICFDRCTIAQHPEKF